MKKHKTKKNRMIFLYIIGTALLIEVMNLHDNPEFNTICIIILIVLALVYFFRKREFNKAVEDCKYKLHEIHNLHDLSIYSNSVLNVKNKKLKFKLAQLIIEKANITPAIQLNLNAPIAKGRPCFFYGKMSKVPHKRVKDDLIPLWDRAEEVSVYVFKNALEWMSETKHDTKSWQNILKVSIDDSGDFISILLRGNNGMLHFQGNNAIVLAAILNRLDSI